MLHRVTKDRKAEGFTLVQLGQFYKREGEYASTGGKREDEEKRQESFTKALVYLKEAVFVHKEQGDWCGMAVPLHDMGVIRINTSLRLYPSQDVPGDIKTLAFLDYADELTRLGVCDPRYQERVKQTILWFERRYPDLRQHFLATGRSARDLVEEELS